MIVLSLQVPPRKAERAEAVHGELLEDSVGPIYVYMYVYVCIYIYIYICFREIYIYIYIYIYMYT